MGYIKNTWVDQDVERPKTYEVTNNTDGSITLTDSFGLVTELGTPVNATNMNHIENALALCDLTQYDASVTYSTGEWVTGVVNNKKGVYASKTNNNTGNALTNTIYWEEVQLGGASRSIGEIVHSTIPIIDAGLHLLDGALISGSGTYAAFVDYMSGLVSTNPDLFETEANWQTSITNYGVCGKFVYDSVNNTVRLPKITGFIEGTVDATALGDLVQAGLPNITGTIAIQASASFSGAFYNGGGTSGDTAPGGSTDNLAVFDASHSSSIYGNSNTVQPQAIKCFMYIVIATTEKTEIEVDIDEIATDLAGKADTDLSNTANKFPNSYFEKLLPDYTAYFDITSDVSTDQKDRSYAYPVVLYGKQNTGGNVNGNELVIKIGSFQATTVDYSYGGDPICVFIPANTTFKCYLSIANVNRHQVLIVPLKGGNYA